MSARRILLGAFGDPGHAFPMIALGRALLARGHEVTLQTWERWRAPVEGEGLTFAPAPEYDVFPIPSLDGDGRPQALDFYEAVVYATRDTLPLVEELKPEVVVADILTLGPSLAAELAGVKRATLIPHVNPQSEQGFPIYSFGARLPRTAPGRKLWQWAHLPVNRGLESGRLALNRTRVEVGLPPLDRVHGGTSEELALVASFPQLEYPRPWPAHMHVIGPLLWEPPAADVELPRAKPGGQPGAEPGTKPRAEPGTEPRAKPGTEPGTTPGASPNDQPLILVAPSTSQDPDHRLLHAALRGLADMPVRVLATWNRRLPSSPLPVPENTRLVEWVSYSRTMPHCDAVICHGGHGTLVRALACGCPVIACPVAGDMNENAARLDWAGAGVRLPRRFISPRGLCLAVERVLGDRAIAATAAELSAWARANDAGDRAARLIEALP